MADEDWDYSEDSYERQYRRVRAQVDHDYMTTVTLGNGMRFSVEGVSFMFHALTQAVREVSVLDPAKRSPPDLDAVLELPGGRALRIPGTWAASYPDIAARLAEIR